MCIHRRCAGATSRWRAAIVSAITSGSIVVAIRAATRVRRGVLGTTAANTTRTMITRDASGPAVSAATGAVTWFSTPIAAARAISYRSEEHTSELQSPYDI